MVNLGRDLYKDSNGNYHEGINQLADENYGLAVGGRILETPTVIEKWLSTSGWYRVAEIPNSNTSSIFTVSSTYNNRNNCSWTIAVNTAHNSAKINVLNTCMNLSTVYYAKVVLDNNKNYLEIYYNAEVGNTVKIELYAKDYRIKLIDFTSTTNTEEKKDGVVLAGYNAIGGIHPVRWAFYNSRK